jgi:glycerol-3-phosphate dehydrogenase (NAD(P)+)
MPHVAIIGNGSWGTALGIVLARKGIHVKLWARTEEDAKQLDKDRENVTYLPGFQFPSRLKVTNSMEKALKKADGVVLAVPAQSMRENAQLLKEHLREETLVISASKGIEVDSGKRMSEALREELNGNMKSNICVLSGPTIAQEAANDMQSVAVIASRDLEVAQRAQHLLMTKSFCLFPSTDVVGVELGGALKNVVALGAGMADGLGCGDNAKAAFITRGLAEMTSLGRAMKADPLTFAGLACMGDILTTCYSPFSRNRYVGEELAKGKSVEEIMGSMPHTAEGITTTLAIRGIAHDLGVDMPITEVLNEVMYDGLSPRDAVAKLVEPPVEHELARIKEKPHPVPKLSERKWRSLSLGLQPRAGGVPT